MIALTALISILNVDSSGQVAATLQDQVGGNAVESIEMGVVKPTNYCWPKRFAA